MTLLVTVLGEHLPAVERDLIVAGYHLHDVGVRLSWAELESFVMAAPPGTAIHTSRTNAWNYDSAMHELMSQQRSTPTVDVPTGGSGAVGQQQRTEPLRNGRGRNLAAEVYGPTGDPNLEVKQLMKAPLLPLDQFKALRDKIQADNAAAAAQMAEESA